MEWGEARAGQREALDCGPLRTGSTAHYLNKQNQ
ncbi:protein of unknown function (plasmid) [Agrobacterium pusense]|uniref:Uncharacterized protein n=1 Tax=Agrobacterium pusense TaxID=648995 RepID=U4QFY1_9HYPH|nr:protein of unknown function [Agrobacterium pusense]